MARRWDVKRIVKRKYEFQVESEEWIEISIGGK